MKILFLSILFIFASGICYSMPAALTRYEIKGEEMSDGTVMDRVVYQEGKTLVLAISEMRYSKTNKVKYTSEMYFYEGELVLQSSWKPKEHEKETDYGDVRTFQSSGKIPGIQVSTQDLENDGLLDQVMIISDDFDVIAFKRNKNGEMIPIVPLILTEEGLIFFKEEKDEPVDGGNG